MKKSTRKPIKQTLKQYYKVVGNVTGKPLVKLGGNKKKIVIFSLKKPQKKL